MTIVEFTRARLDEDEQTALQDPHPEHSRPILSYIDYGEIEIGTARVLAQVAAMRAIVDLHQPGHVGDCRLCLDAAYPEGVLMESWPCSTVLQLAAIWSDHPDYDPAWSPDA